MKDRDDELVYKTNALVVKYELEDKVIEEDVPAHNVI